MRERKRELGVSEGEKKLGVSEGEKKRVGVVQIYLRWIYVLASL